jgi:hypothetical protein
MNLVQLERGQWLCVECLVAGYRESLAKLEESKQAEKKLRDELAAARAQPSLW